MNNILETSVLSESAVADRRMELHIDEAMQVDVKAEADSEIPFSRRPPERAVEPVTYAPYTISPLSGNDESERGKYVVHFNAPRDV
jgi:hypothetical protein